MKMKNFILLLCLTISAMAMNAQDKLTFRSGKTLNVKVVELTGSEVKYKMFDDLTGPLLTESLSNLYYIKYEDGEMMIFGGGSRARSSRSRTKTVASAPTNYPAYQPSAYMPSYTPEYPAYRPSRFSENSTLTKQVDMYFQDGWGVGFMLRKEINQYVGWNIIGVSYMSSWYRLTGPDKHGLINVRLPGIRLYSPAYESIRAYAELNIGYTHEYLFWDENYHFNYFGLDFSAGFQVHKNIAIGYNLTYGVNSGVSFKNHWGKLSILF